MLLFMSLVALVVDLGNARQNKRYLWNTVDAAALRAAAVYDGTPATESLAKAAGISLLDANSLGKPGYECTLPCKATFTFTQSTTKTCVMVHVTEFQSPTFFGGAIGVDKLTMDGYASGCKRRAGGVPLPAAFAMGDTCGVGVRDKAFKTTGNSNIFEGSIHSNNWVHDSGTGNTATGAKSYVAGIDQDKGLWAGATQVSYQPPPALVSDWELTDLNATSSLATDLGSTTDPDIPGKFFYDLSGNEVKIENIGVESAVSGGGGKFWNIPAGVYFTDRKITLNKPIHVVPKEGRLGATFISSAQTDLGFVDVAASDSTLVPFDDPRLHRLLIATFADPGTPESRCSTDSVVINSSTCLHFDGYIYAPTSKIRFGGEGNGHGYAGVRCSTPYDSNKHLDFSGGLLSWAIEHSGNWNLLRSGTTAASDQTLFLDE
jgi:hypothetical protein